MRFLLVWFNTLAPNAVILIFPLTLIHRLIFIELEYPCSESATEVLMWVCVFSITPLYIVSVIPKYEKFGAFKEMLSEDKDEKEINNIKNKKEEDHE